MVVRTGAAGAAPDGEATMAAGPRARPLLRSALSGRGRVETRQTQLSVWKSPIVAGANLSANEEEGGGGGAAGQALAGVGGERGRCGEDAGGRGRDYSDGLQRRTTPPVMPPVAWTMHRPAV